MSETFPLSAGVGFIVEERLLDDPTTVNFAWLLDTQEEAEALLLDSVRNYGNTRIFTAFISVG